MRSLLAKTLMRLAQWVRPKAVPYALAGTQWTGSSYVDSFRRTRNPTPNEILAELKNTAWTCASINSATCANYPPRLYVITEHNQPQAKCATKALSPRAERRVRSLPHLHVRAKSAARIEEVTDHPLLTLLHHANSVLNAFDLWELTTLYQEVHGGAYWYLDLDPALGVPRTGVDFAVAKHFAAPRPRTVRTSSIITSIATAAAKSASLPNRLSTSPIPIRAIRTRAACRPYGPASSKPLLPATMPRSKRPNSRITRSRTPSFLPMK